MTLDGKDIALMLISAVVGYIASVVANFTTSPISSFWEGRRSKVIERNKNKAFSEYAIIEKLHSGAIDKTIYFIQWHLMMTVMISLSIIGFLVPHSTPAAARPTLLSLMDMVMFLFSLFLAAYVLGSVKRFNLWRTRLNNFEEYKATLESTFGPIQAPTKRFGLAE